MEEWFDARLKDGVVGRAAGSSPAMRASEIEIRLSLGRFILLSILGVTIGKCIIHKFTPRWDGWEITPWY
jgi:hypothetical protein